MLQTTRTRLVDSAEESLTQLSELEGARIAASLDDQRNAAEALALDTALLELSLIHISSPRDKRQSRMPSSA